MKKIEKLKQITLIEEFRKMYFFWEKGKQKF